MVEENLVGSAVRLIASALLLAIGVMSTLGIVWSLNATPAQPAAGRIVLGVCVLAAAAGLCALWMRRTQPR